MIEVRLTITHPDGTTSEDVATGNTFRTAKAAGLALGRSYENEGCTVAARIMERKPRVAFDA